MKSQNIAVLHARGHVPAAIGALAKKLRGGRLLFDIRGFMPEEYVDAGVWTAGGLLYRLVKAAERRLMSSADGFVVLTEQARRILFPGRADFDAKGRPVEVIPCCVDMARFDRSGLPSRDRLREEMGFAGRRVIVYLGALGGWYLTDEMADLLSVAHEQDAATFSLILTQSRPEMIEPLLKEGGVSAKDYFIAKLSPADVPRYLQAADIALSFIKPCYSKRASSPTKIAEYLAAGLPVICNAGIGDLDEVVEADRVGVIASRLDRESYLQALSDVESLRREAGLSERCRASARARYDLEKVGGPRYRRIYDRLLTKEEFSSVFSQAL
jgi:glycosyltransferase involved in cell wall biosynthesis